MYLLEVNAYTCAMVIIYGLFLRNKPLYGLSRAYLIGAAVLPLLMPLLSLPGNVQQKIQTATALQFTLPAVNVNAAVQNLAPSTSIHFSFWWGYGIVALLLLVWRFSGVMKVMAIIARSHKQEHDGYSLITGTGYGPGSFGRYIFFPETEVNATILAHEQAHISWRHTADVLLLSLLQSLFWPSIFLTWICRELKEIHEFEADALVKADTQDYAQLLLCSVFKTTSIPIMHPFINHPLKRRVMMLSKKNGKASPVKATLFVAASLCMVIAMGLCIQSCSKQTINPQVSGSKEADGQVYATADVMPRYIGDSLFRDLSHNLKYPEYALKNKIEGRVIVKFVVSKDGTVLNPEIVKSPDTSLSRAVLEVVGNLRDWEPGRMKNGEKVNVWFYLPVLFDVAK